MNNIYFNKCEKVQDIIIWDRIRNLLMPLQTTNKLCLLSIKAKLTKSDGQTNIDKNREMKQNIISGPKQNIYVDTQVKQE